MRGSDGSPANGAWADGTRCNHAMAAIIEVPEEAGAPEGQGGKRPRNERKRNFCPHQRHKSQCRDCGGSGLCVHGRHKRAGARSAEAPASARTSARACVQGVRPGRASRACVQGRLAQPNKKRHAGRPRVVFYARARLFIASEDSRGARHRGDASIRVVQCCSRLGGLRGTLFAATICVHAEVYREAPLIMCNEVC
jgi:hypothetical protein